MNVAGPTYTEEPRYFRINEERLNGSLPRTTETEWLLNRTPAPGLLFLSRSDDRADVQGDLPLGDPSSLSCVLSNFLKRLAGLQLAKH